ncbi:MAG: hypothetical protein ABJD11_16990 [Gemmatimonadota bacterium]
MLRPTLISLLLLSGGVLCHAQVPKALPLDTLEALVRADSNDAMAHYDLAMGYWGKKRWDDAERELRLGVSIAPSFAESYLALAALPQARGESYWKKRIKQDGIESARQAFLQSRADFRRAFLLNPLVDLRVLGKFEGDERRRWFCTAISS